MSKPIRILQVIGIMNRGGAETMIMNLYRNIDRSKIQFDFVENTYERALFDDEIESLGGKIYHCPHFTINNYLEYKRWWENFFKEHNEEYKIVHGHIGSTAAIYLYIAKKYNIFTIAHSHSSSVDTNLKGFLYKLGSYPTRYIADYFFACSKVAGIDRYGSKVVNSKKFSLLNNAIDVKEFAFNSKIRDDIRRELGIKDEILVGHIGRFTQVKNHQYLVDVFNEFSKIIPNSKLILVGDGPLKLKIKQYVETKGLEDKIIFSGVREDVNRLVQGMDCFVFPSLYEGLGVALIESQTSGLPCIISKNIPMESIITKNLVTIMSLDDSPKTWAKHIINRLSDKRYDRSDEIIKAGYDISCTSKWLEEFYIEKYKSN